MEKLKFNLPAVFTIGPEDTQEALEKYAILLTGGPEAAKRPGAVSSEGSHIQKIVKGVIEGETRSIISTSK